MKKNLYIFIFITFIFLVQKVFTSFSISEIFPNTSDDTTEEYIQISYDGIGNNSLSGYTLSDKSGKEFIFSEDIYINGESKKYFRPQTKILLNNSDEEVYLKNNSGILLDTFSYSTTEVGKVYKKNTQENIQNSNSGITQTGSTNSGSVINENTSSGSTNTGTIDYSNTNSGSTNSGSTNTLTGSVDNNTSSGTINNNSTGTGTFKEIIIKNTFQTPTYLTDKDRELTNNIVYNCDRTKDDCRVNFDFSNTFSTDIKENDFSCFIDFGLGGITGEENKCNPNTIIFPIGVYNLKIKIFNKLNINYYSEINFKVINDGKIVTNSTSSSVSYSYTNIVKPSKLNLENPNIKVQGGLEKDNTCNKKDCSVNFLYEPIFDNITCLWNFGSGTFDSNTNKKCNPSYVSFPSGKHNITLEICDINYENNCKKSEYIFENKYKYLEPKSIITLQGKLSKNKILENDKIICIGSEKCSINLTGQESIGNELSYFWDFGDSEFFDGKNPSSHIFLEGNYDVILQVNDNDGGFSESIFYVEVKPKDEEIISIKEIELEKSESNLSSFETKEMVSLKIDLQGKLGSNKKVSGDTLTCIKTCSVNLDGSKSIGDFESYFWDFGNGETYIGKNPPYINYENFGKYTVLFSLEDKLGNIYEKEFFIDYKKEENKKEITKEEDKNISENNYTDEEEIKQDNEIKNEDIEIYEEKIPISKPFIIFIILITFGAGLVLLKRYKII